MNKDQKEEEGVYYIMRKGKRIKKTRRGRSLNNTIEKNIVGYF